jgi:hypothetical protein
MCAPFDYESLKDAYGQLKKEGEALQKEGLKVVRVADSGLSNVAAVQSLIITFSNLSAPEGKVGEFVDLFSQTGKYTLDLVNQANFGLSKGRDQVDLGVSLAESAVTMSSLSAGTSVFQMIQAVPESEEDLMVAWKAHEPARGFADEELDSYLERFDSELPRRRKGAWTTFDSVSEDAVAQASHTMRDILAKVIAKEASNEKIYGCSWYLERKNRLPETKPVIEDRIRFLLYGQNDAGFDAVELENIKKGVSQYVSDDGTLKKIAHGSVRYEKEAAKLSMQKIEELLFLVLKRLYDGRQKSL